MSKTVFKPINDIDNTQSEINYWSWCLFLEKYDFVGIKIIMNDILESA